jgi:hypothetical protein
MMEGIVLIGLLAFVGIAAEITAPLALAIIVCLLLPPDFDSRKHAEP